MAHPEEAVEVAGLVSCQGLAGRGGRHGRGVYGVLLQRLLPESQGLPPRPVALCNKDEVGALKAALAEVDQTCGETRGPQQ